MRAGWGPHGSGRRVEAFFRQREKSGETGWATGMEFSDGPLDVSGDAGWWDPQ